MVAEAPNLCVIYASHSCTLDVGNITKSLYCNCIVLMNVGGEGQGAARSARAWMQVQRHTGRACGARKETAA